MTGNELWRLMEVVKHFRQRGKGAQQDKMIHAGTLEKAAEFEGFANACFINADMLERVLEAMNKNK